MGCQEFHPHTQQRKDGGSSRTPGTAAGGKVKATSLMGCGSLSSCELMRQGGGTRSHSTDPPAGGRADQSASGSILPTRTALLWLCSARHLHPRPRLPSDPFLLPERPH